MTDVRREGNGAALLRALGAVAALVLSVGWLLLTGIEIANHNIFENTDERPVGGGEEAVAVLAWLIGNAALWVLIGPSRTPRPQARASAAGVLALCVAAWLWVFR